MTTIDQIRAEIERRRKIYMEEYKDYKSTSAFSKACECVELLKFLDTLKEQPVDLEKEIEMYFKDWDTNPNGAFFNEEGYKIDTTALKNIARHFYELGRQSKEQPICEGLEEEIKRYYEDMDGDCRYAQTARHFAKWQREKMIGNAIIGEVILSHGQEVIEHKSSVGIQESSFPNMNRFSVGDKVFIIITK